MVVYQQDLNEDAGENITFFQEIPRFSECRKDNAKARLHNEAAEPGF